MDSKYQCMKCFVAFPNDPELKEHIPNCPFVIDPEIYESFHENIPKRAILNDSKFFKYKCELCDKSFERLDRLKRHEVVHTKEKKFNCNFCQKSFGRRDHLRTHLRTVHKSNQIVCQYCSESFYENDAHKAHLKTCAKNVTNIKNKMDTSIVKFEEIKMEPPDIKTEPYDNYFENDSLQNEDNSKNMDIDPLAMSDNEKLPQIKNEQMNETICNTKRRTHNLENVVSPTKKNEYLKKLGLNKAIAASIDTKSILNNSTDQKIYQCDLCNKVFDVQNRLNRHKMTHLGLKPFNCEVCNKSFTRKDHVQRHMRAQHVKEGCQQCPFCTKKFTLKEYLIKHLVRHQKNTKCAHCNQHFETGDEYKRHISDVTRKSEKILVDVNQIEQRIRELENEQPKKSNKEMITDMIQGISDDQRELGEITWNDVSQELIDAATLDESKVENGDDDDDLKQEEKFKAQESSFFSGHAIFDSVSTNYEDNSQIFECNKCNKTITGQSEIKQHMLTHTSVKQFMCDFCPASFSRSSHLQRHMLAHLDVKTYTCDFCSKAFMRKDHLKKHLWTHTDEKLFKCSHCPKEFRHKDSLQRHEKYVHGFILDGFKNEELICTVCNKVFMHKKSLKSHMDRGHEFLKIKFNCEECPASFLFKKALRKHFLTEHGANYKFKQKLATTSKS